MFRIELVVIADPWLSDWPQTKLGADPNGSVGFPPTSRNTLAEDVSHCEAYISCTIRSLANKLVRSRFAMTAALIAPSSGLGGQNAE